MTNSLQDNDLYVLQSLLIRKNREFTDGMRMGKKHQELVVLYNEMKNIYKQIFQKRSPNSYTAAFTI